MVGEAQMTILFVLAFTLLQFIFLAGVSSQRTRFKQASPSALHERKRLELRVSTLHPCQWDPGLGVVPAIPIRSTSLPSISWFSFSSLPMPFFWEKNKAFFRRSESA
jgi:hypothetical protein